MSTNRFKALVITIGLLSTGYVGTNIAAPMNLSDVPLSFSQTAAPLTMLVMGRDHKLFYEAYNDASDLNNNGALNTVYTPAIDYYGYFDSYKCYTYNSGQSRFNPVTVTSNKTCNGSQWSGDFLNYLTMSRMDTLAKVLYGGERTTDNTGGANAITVLTRAFIPQDGHSWGKQYTSVAVDGYNIANYAPYALPAAGRKILFANTTLLGTTTPLLRVLTNQTSPIWEWVSQERPVAGNNIGIIPVIPSDFTVAVRVCNSAIGLESNCQTYPDGSNKPVGLLQQFGANDQMLFGLITGSYTKNLSGGVLRKNISSLSNEIDDDTGALTSTVGIIRTIDRIAITGFGGAYEYSCGWIVNRPMSEGECTSWGNPVGEMMYEALRYFAGKGSPTSAYNYGSSSTGDDGALSLPKPNWQNPYATNPYCAIPSMLVISDINPSYDSDQIPGSSFASFTGDLSGFNASSLGQTIWNGEFGGTSKQIFIGQSGATYDGAPSAKAVSSFGTIRGLAPEEPTKQGSYYSASAAYYGWLNDVSSAQDTQQVKTFAVALSSPLPKININVNGKTVTIIPFAKTVGGCTATTSNGSPAFSASSGAYQPTNAIVDFYVESLTATTGTFRVNFEDQEQGADYDMDAIARYSYAVGSGNTVNVTVDASTYAAGCLIQHIGYIISGTTADGTYLVARDADTLAADDVNYFLDTPQHPGSALPLSNTRPFTASSTGSAASFLNDPLWYAAKWGGFNDINGNNIPDLTTEWDTDSNGIPDNYFLVTNALNLQQKLAQAFTGILARSGNAAALSVNNGALNSNTTIYQTLFNTGTWTGQLLAFPINTDGSINTSGSAANGAEWDAGAQISSQNFNTRQILTYKPSSRRGIPFRWPVTPSSPSTTELDTAQSAVLNTNPATSLTDNLGQRRLNYLRGSGVDEATVGGPFRSRTSKLGDIIDSGPVYVQRPAFNYSDNSWPTGAAENSVLYSAFKSTYFNRTPMLYVGANDGMLHGINADTGLEVFAYVPGKVFNNLNKLTSQTYTHNFYADGSPNIWDAFFGGSWHTILVSGLGKGGQGVFALDVTNPSAINETGAQSVALWEFTDNNTGTSGVINGDRDMGYSYSQPAIARMAGASGKWVAIFGNGYNNTVSDGGSTTSTTGDAVLYIVDVQTGNLIREIDTGVGSSQDPTGTGRPNGLSTPAVVDANGDGIAEYVYAGDLFGNLWKFDISNSNASNWGSAYTTSGSPTPFFVARDASNRRQPITTRPSIDTRPSANNVGVIRVFFGTGKYLEPADKDITTATTQTFYGLIDNGTIITGRSQLLQQTLTQVTVGSVNYRVASSNVLTTQKGWYIDLPTQGERQITNSVLRNLKIIFTTMIPSTDVCGAGGSSWLIEVDQADGSAPTSPIFDLNNDRLFNAGDLITSGGNNYVVSGIQSTVGIISMPTIVTDLVNGVEYKYTPGSSGGIGMTVENPSSQTQGRQSWRQLR